MHSRERLSSKPGERENSIRTSEVERRLIPVKDKAKEKGRGGGKLLRCTGADASSNTGKVSHVFTEAKRSRIVYRKWKWGGRMSGGQN